MELELQNQTFSCYQAKKEQLEFCERSAETIVPDYCPDIVRIVDSSASLFLRGSEIIDGRVSISGTVKINVLYMAESGAGLKSFEYTLPLNHTLNSRLQEGCIKVFLNGNISEMDVHLVNPRKVAARIAACFSVQSYCVSECTVCSGITQQKEYNIETLSEGKMLSLIKEVSEKEFLFREQIVLSAAKDPISEILRTSQRLHLEESKVIGSKVLLKGNACIEILYLSDRGSIQQLCSELPFSQLIEIGETSGEQFRADTCLRLSNAEYQLERENNADGRVIDVSLYLTAMTHLYETKTVSCITDLYSTSHALEIKTVTTEISSAPEMLMQELPIREQIETGTDVSAILFTNVMISPATVHIDAEKSIVKASGTVKVLYIDENGVPYCAERHWEGECEFVPMNNPIIREISTKQITAIPTAAGIDVRFAVCILLESLNNESETSISSIQVLPCEEEKCPMPSLVLRRLEAKENLWHLAKKHRTTVEAILSANNCQEESAVKSGQMLLIPKKR